MTREQKIQPAAPTRASNGGLTKPTHGTAVLLALQGKARIRPDDAFIIVLVAIGLVIYEA